MSMLLAGLVVAGLIPLLLALRANRGTSLTHALLWAIVAWLSWGVAFLIGPSDEPGMDAGRYFALCLTGCAGVAVLGARRPHVAAWDFVVLGLLAVMLLPLVESQFIGTHPVDGLRIFFMSATIAVGILNYLPTRLSAAAFVLMLACSGQIALLFVPEYLPGRGEALGIHCLLTAVPWIGWISFWRDDSQRGEFDRLWLGFRDRWGLLWGQRVREQFNNAAQNAGWPVRLRWQGLTTENVSDEPRLVETMRAALRRFLAEDQNL